MAENTTFIATGDAFMTRRLPEGGYPGFAEIREIINKHDVKFNNLEITIHNQEGYPAVVSGDYGSGGVLENIWRSVMAGFTAEDGKITQIQLYPITLCMGAPRSKMGNPHLSDDKVLHYLAELSAPFGTKLNIKDNMATIDL